MLIMDILDKIGEFPDVREKQKTHNYDKTLKEFSNKFRYAKNWKKVADAYIDIIYENIIVLPYPFQPSKATEYINIFKARGLFPADLTSVGDKSKRYRYMWNIAETTPDFSEEFEFLKKKIKEEKRYIKDILRSKSFKAARFITPSKQRLNLKKTRNI